MSRTAKGDQVIFFSLLVFPFVFVFSIAANSLKKKKMEERKPKMDSDPDPDLEQNQFYSMFMAVRQRRTLCMTAVHMKFHSDLYKFRTVYYYWVIDYTL